MAVIEFAGLFIGDSIEMRWCKIEDDVFYVKKSNDWLPSWVWSLIRRVAGIDEWQPLHRELANDFKVYKEYPYNPYERDLKVRVYMMDLTTRKQYSVEESQETRMELERLEQINGHLEDGIREMQQLLRDGGHTDLLRGKLMDMSRLAQSSKPGYMHNKEGKS